MMKQFYLADEHATAVFAAQIAKYIKPNTTFYLHGDLGAGKTTFVRGFLRALGYKDKVKSPTYTLVESYECANQLIFHFDLYRLENAQQLLEIGIHDYFAQQAICFIEWPEKGFPLLPLPDIHCYIKFENEGRQISLEAHSTHGEALLLSL